MKRVVIIIVNFNGKGITKNCLDSIKKNTFYENYKIILVDNGSKDGTPNMVKSNYKEVDVIENEKNEGFSKANNIGIKHAIKKYNPGYFYLLNNDTLVEKNWLTEAIKTMEKFPNAGIVGSKQLTFEKKSAISAGWIKMFGVKYYFGLEEKEVEWVSGAGFMIKKEVIKKIGLLDEIYSLAYYEETYFEKRAREKGFKIYHSPKSVFLHKGGETASKNNNLTRMFYRNRYIFFHKYYPFIYFIPRFFIDLIRGLKNKNLKLVLRGYRDGRKIIKNEKRKKF